MYLLTELYIDMKIILLFNILLFSLLPLSHAEQLDALTWPEVKEHLMRTDIAIIPVGATEQTGPYNPCGSDYFIAEHVAREVGNKTKVLVTPVVSVGISAKHRQFTCTLWVPAQVFYDYVKYQALSLAQHGIKKILIINGHGGNANTLFELSGDLRRNHDVFTAIVSALPEDSPLITQLSDVSHGGWAMTSVGLYLYPKLIKDLKKAKDVQQRGTLGGLQLQDENRIGPEGGPYAKFDADAVDLTPNGVLGQAGLRLGVQGASSEKGQQLIEPRIDELVRLTEAIKKADADALLSKPQIK